MSITWLQYMKLLNPSRIGGGVCGPCIGCPGSEEETEDIAPRVVNCPYGYGSNSNCTKCWNQQIQYPVIAEAVRNGFFKGNNYSVGDKFIVLEMYENINGDLMIGTNSHWLPYNNDFKFYIDNDYAKDKNKVEKTKEYTIDDLKDGMMCEMRDGERMLWLSGAMRSIRYWCKSQHDLTGVPIKSFDIVKVGYPNFDKNPTIGSALKGDFKEVIWERVEEKEISIDEAMRVLQEHYGCNVKIKDY